MTVKLGDLLDEKARGRLEALAAGAADDPAPAEEEPPAEEKADGGIEHKADAAAQVLEADDDTGTVVALVSATGIEDKVKDIIEPGAYTKTIAKREPIGVWSHDDKTWVARTEEAVELPPGDPFLRDLKTMDGEPWPAEAGAVKVRSRFNLDTPHGAAAYSDVKFFQGKTGWSIGYRATKAHRNPRTGVRHIKELDWYEYSPVMVGAASQPMTLSVKSMAQPVDADDPTGFVDEETLEELTADELARLDTIKAAFGLEVKAKPTLPGEGERFPIANTADLRKAVAAYGRAKPEDRDKVKRWIMKRARELDAVAVLPSKWTSDAMAAKDFPWAKGGADKKPMPAGHVAASAVKAGMEVAFKSLDGQVSGKVTAVKSAGGMMLLTVDGKEHRLFKSAAVKVTSGGADDNTSKLDPELLERKDRVRTAAGQARYHMPIGSIILPHAGGGGGAVTKESARKVLSDAAAGASGEARRMLTESAKDYDPANKEDAHGASVALRMAAYQKSGAEAKLLTDQALALQQFASAPGGGSPGGGGGSQLRKGSQVRVGSPTGPYAEVDAVNGDSVTVTDHRSGRRSTRKLADVHPAPDSPYGGPNVEVGGQPHLRSEPHPSGGTYGDVADRGGSKLPPAPAGIKQDAWEAAHNHSLQGLDPEGEDRAQFDRIASEEGIDRGDLVDAAAAIDTGSPRKLKTPASGSSSRSAQAARDSFARARGLKTGGVILELKLAHESLNRSPKRNWIEAVGGQLPAYIQHIAKDISEERGVPLDRAIPIAIGTVKRWARGGGGVKGDTIAKAAAAVAEWEALKAKAHAKTDSELYDHLEVKGSAILEAWDLLVDEGIVEVVEAKDLELDDEPPVDDFAELLERGHEVKDYTPTASLEDLRALRAQMEGSGPFEVKARGARQPAPVPRAQRAPKHPARGGAQPAKKAAAAPAAGGKNARVVRTEAGARRYGVAVGKPYTSGALLHWGAVENPAVQRAQELLVRLGLLEPRKDGTVHGNFGDKTKAALKKFQKQNGLPVTGMLDPATGRKLQAVTPGGDPQSGAAGTRGSGSAHPTRSLASAGGASSPPPVKRTQDWYQSLPPAVQKRVMKRAKEIIAARRPAR